MSDECYALRINVRSREQEIERTPQVQHFLPRNLGGLRSERVGVRTEPGTYHGSID
jgi:hypothetical protein